MLRRGKYYDTVHELLNQGEDDAAAQVPPLAERCRSKGDVISTLSGLHSEARDLPQDPESCANAGCRKQQKTQDELRRKQPGVQACMAASAKTG
jgi:DNA-binding ferritin-like protein